MANRDRQNGNTNARKRKPTQIAKTHPRTPATLLLTPAASFEHGLITWTSQIAQDPEREHLLLCDLLRLKRYRPRELVFAMVAKGLKNPAALAAECLLAWSAPFGSGLGFLRAAGVGGPYATLRREPRNRGSPIGSPRPLFSRLRSAPGPPPASAPPRAATGQVLSLSKTRSRQVPGIFSQKHQFAAAVRPPPPAEPPSAARKVRRPPAGPSRQVPGDFP